MTNKIYFLLTCFLVPYFLLAQQSRSVVISGYITEQGSNETLVGASVRAVPAGSWTQTDAFGHYTLAVTATESVRLEVRYAGYMPLDTVIRINAGKAQQINLSLSTQTLGTVYIEAQERQIEPNISRIPVERLKSIPSLLGQPDLIKALAFIPGVSTGVEGTTGLYVRGGTPDQNLILLDGATVYNASHLFGFQSVFDPAAIKDITLIKGGFPARYGGRLSSIIDITMKEGNNLKRHGEATLGIINAGLMLEGPIHKERSAYMLSARTAYPGLFLLAAGRNGNRSTLLNYDVCAKVNFTLKNQDRLFLSFYSGYDNYLFTYRFDTTAQYKTTFGWGNRTFSVRHTKSIGDRIFLNTWLNYNTYRIGETYEQRPLTDPTVFSFVRWSSVADAGVRQQISFRAGTPLLLQAGWTLNTHRFQPSNAAIRTNRAINADSLIGENRIFKPMSAAFFVAGEWQVTRWLKADMGGRLSIFRTDQNTYTYAEPRLNLMTTKGCWLFNVGYARMSQFVHLLANNSIGLFSDLWVPSTDQIPPQTSDQVSAGATWKAKDKDMEIGLEGFHKMMHQQIDFRQGIDFFAVENLDWQNVVERNGIGRAYGIECMFRYGRERYNGWVSYTLSRSERRFANISQGDWYPHRYDRLHNLNITFDYKLSANWRLGVNSVYQSGHWLTLPSGLFIAGSNFDQGDLPTDLVSNGIYRTPRYVTRRNNQRLPAYHRADCSLTRSFEKNRRGRSSNLVFSIYNIYARRNPYVVNLTGISVTNTKEPLQQTTQWQLASRALFVFVPSVAYSVKW